jgi:cytochrome b6-f complex iron-sulfur subunit
MSAAAIIAIAIAAVVILAALAFVTLARRSDVRGAGALSAETRRRDAAARESRPTDEVVEHAPTRQEAERAGELARYGTGVATVPETAIAPWSPPDPDAIGVSRRQFFNRATVTLMSAGIGAFSAASMVAFLWPTGTGGFGQVVNLGKLDDIKQGIRDGQGFFYAPAARAWVTEYPADALPKAALVYPESILSGMQQAGIVALYQKCPHLGCRVPQCVTSQWFECPCHGSQYNQVGEKKGGPAPRGMDRFPITLAGNGDVSVNTAASAIVPGPPIGTNTTGQEAEGPHCITGGGEH